MHQYTDLIRIFNDCFLASHNTMLVAGESEPIYLPADGDCKVHRIIFAHGFFTSALHEIAHWCVAGPQRRLIEDYGYWYAPDGRDAEQQKAFESVEVRPQAYEWILSQSCGLGFNVSADNLSGIAIDRLAFQHRVHDEVSQILIAGLNPRMAQLSQVLRQFYQQPALQFSQFQYSGMYFNLNSG
ncbi:elongation factor P hydroxylase [Motilimonas pumila]|uniref:elongation factor P hydroxylase n=1 Tax=Motilimonas pumila TaxID=2303987 RepID=UPI001E487788|nr:elongation factor P hydroxylase [Motilimonas pumila]